MNVMHDATALRQIPFASSRSAAGWRVVAPAFVFLILAITLLQRFGLNFGSYSLNAALVAMFLFLAVAAAAGGLGVSGVRLCLYGVCMVAALSSALLNERTSSFTSLALLAVMYLPFVFVLTPAAGLGPARARDIFLDVAAFCAVAGVVQFYAQFVFHAGWLFDFTPHVPTFLRGPSGYNTVIQAAGSLKSNGFFFREPSGFSFVMALALMTEWLSHRRLPRVAFLGLALLLTYSGTGLLALVIGLLFPMSGRNLVRLLFVAAGGAALFFVLEGPLNLSFTVARLQEFGSESSSAYIRYIAPGRLIADVAAAAPEQLWLGHGPGTIFRQQLGYEFHDPTWAKLIFEYGVVGLVAFLALFLTSLGGAAAPIRLRAMLFGGWLLMGGHLLSPEQNFMTLALVGLFPPPGATAAVPERGRPGAVGLLVQEVRS
jgi:hypothetical protein